MHESVPTTKLPPAPFPCRDMFNGYDRLNLTLIIKLSIRIVVFSRLKDSTVGTRQAILQDFFISRRAFLAF